MKKILQCIHDVELQKWTAQAISNYITIGNDLIVDMTSYRAYLNNSLASDEDIQAASNSSVSTVLYDVDVCHVTRRFSRYTHDVLVELNCSTTWAEVRANTVRFRFASYLHFAKPYANI